MKSVMVLSPRAWQMPFTPTAVGMAETNDMHSWPRERRGDREHLVLCCHALVFSAIKTAFAQGHGPAKGRLLRTPRTFPARGAQTCRFMIGGLGVAPWLFHRISGLILIALVGLKIYSGYSDVGKVPKPDLMIGLHMKPWLDVSLIFFLCFHVAYGLRLMLIDLGVTRDRLLFWLFTVLALIGFSASYYALYIRH